MKLRGRRVGEEHGVLLAGGIRNDVLTAPDRPPVFGKLVAAVGAQRFVGNEEVFLYALADVEVEIEFVGEIGRCDHGK